MKKLKWHTEKRIINQLIPYENNPRIMTEKQKADLQKSLEEFDLVEIPAIDTDNKIIAGHQRLKIMQMLGRGDEEIDVRIPNRKLTEDEFKRYNLRSNKNTGEWDWDLLANFDEELLIDVGFEIEELNSKFDIEGVEEDDFDIDKAVEEAKEPICKEGDIWILGKHRLMCGDSTKREDVEKLMDGKKADMVFTDPPYGMNLNTDWSNAKSKLRFYKEKGCKGQGNKYNRVIGDEKEFNPEFIFNTFNCKEIFLWGADYYKEYIPKYGSWFVWDKRSNEETDVSIITKTDKMYGSCFELCWSKNNHKREIIRIKWAGIFGTETEPDKDKSRKHPTQKPVRLSQVFIDKFSKKDNLILDLFLGSGSTLIACEQTNRVCFGMEIDPVYCDVIIKRWENYTGNKAVKINE